MVRRAVGCMERRRYAPCFGACGWCISAFGFHAPYGRYSVTDNPLYPSILAKAGIHRLPFRVCAVVRFRAGFRLSPELSGREIVSRAGFIPPFLSDARGGVNPALFSFASRAIRSRSLVLCNRNEYKSARHCLIHGLLICLLYRLVMKEPHYLKYLD
jgi:hypothetical protein